MDNRRPYTAPQSTSPGVGAGARAPQLKPDTAGDVGGGSGENILAVGGGPNKVSNNSPWTWGTTMPAGASEVADGEHKPAATALAKAYADNALSPFKQQQEEWQQELTTLPRPVSSNNSRTTRWMASSVVVADEGDIDEVAGGGNTGAARATDNPAVQRAESDKVEVHGSHTTVAAAAAAHPTGASRPITTAMQARGAGSEIASGPKPMSAPSKMTTVNAVPHGVSPGTAATAVAVAASKVAWPLPLPLEGSQCMSLPARVLASTSSPGKIGGTTAEPKGATKPVTVETLEPSSYWWQQEETQDTARKPESAGMTSASTVTRDAAAASPAPLGRGGIERAGVHLEMAHILPGIVTTATAATPAENVGSAAAPGAVAKTALLERRTSSSSATCCSGFNESAWSAFSAASWCSSSFDGDETPCGAPAATVRSPASYFGGGTNGFEGSI